MAGMFDDFIPQEEKIAELKRELKQREFVYPRLIANKRLTQERADRQVAVLKAILKDYGVALAPSECRHESGCEHQTSQFWLCDCPRGRLK